MRIRPWLLGPMAVAVALAWLLGAQPAHAHGGVGPGQNVLTAWSWEPSLPLGVILVGALYAVGLRSRTDPSHPVRGWQRVSFFAGLAVIFLALQSPIDSLSDHLFLVHQVQHLLLRMVGPPLLLLGAPLTPCLRGIPVAARRRAVRPLVRNAIARRLYAVFTSPLVAALLFVGTLYFWQGPAAHNLSVRNDGVHYLMHFTMLLSAVLFWWVVIDPKPRRSRMSYGARALYLGFLAVPNLPLGAMIAFSPDVLYTAYGEVERLWGISLLADQAIGGTILWIPPAMMNLLAAVIMIGMWLQREEEQQRAKEARQSARSTNRTGALPS